MGSTLTLRNDVTSSSFFQDTNGDLHIDTSGNDINIHNTDTVRILNTADSTSISTGSMVVSGGMGVSKMSHMLELTVNNGGGLTDSTSGALRVLGGASIQNGFSAVGFSKFYDVVNSYLTDDSTSTSTGALQVAGGVGIAKNLYVGGTLSVGTHNASGDVPISGYITIKDSAGNDRKLAVIS
jgi:hypothetical protein